MWHTLINGGVVSNAINKSIGLIQGDLIGCGVLKSLEGFKDRRGGRVFVSSSGGGCH